MLIIIYNDLHDNHLYFENWVQQFECSNILGTQTNWLIGVVYFIPEEGGYMIKKMVDTLEHSKIGE